MSEDEQRRLATKAGKYFNTLLPTSPDMEWHFKEYQPLRDADPTRDDTWGDLHDCIMSNIFHQLKIWGKSSEGKSPEHFMSNPFTHVSTRGMFPERATSMALRAVEEWLDRHGYEIVKKA